MGHRQQVVESSLSKLGLSILSEFNDQKMHWSHLIFCCLSIIPPESSGFPRTNLLYPCSMSQTCCAAFRFLVSMKSDACNRFRMQGKNRFMPVHKPHPMNSVVRDDYYESDNPRIVSWLDELVRSICRNTLLGQGVRKWRNGLYEWMMSTWYFKIRWYFTMNFEDSICLQMIWRCYGISLYFTHTPLQMESSDFFLFPYIEVACISGIPMYHQMSMLVASCPSTKSTLETQVWNELREGWEVFWYETWRTFGLRFSERVLVNCKTQGFRTRQDWWQDDEMTMEDDEACF